MKVSGHTPLELPASKTSASNTPKPHADAAQTARASASNPGVAVVIASSSRALGKEALGTPADVDTKKVSAMKAAIADGSFKVNPEAIADKLLSNAREMLDVQPK